MFLTSPFIDQAITRFEPQSGILSEIAIFQQLGVPPSSISLVLRLYSSNSESNRR
jgi:hypothetical protein